MIYLYKCVKCGLSYEIKASINEDRPDNSTCICGGLLKYDWSQFDTHTVLMPERHKA